MKILAITNMYPTEAFPSQGVFVREQIKGLCAIGLEVRVLFVDRRREGPLAYFRMRGKILEAIAGFDPDVIHVMYGGVMADRIVRQNHGRPIVVTFRGSDLLGENLSGLARKIISHYGVRCSRRAAKMADGVVVVARHLIDAMNGAVSREKVRVIPSGIDLERFKPMDPQQCKKTLRWSSQSFHVVFASSCGDPVKRPWLGQAAVDQARRLGCPAEFHFITGIPTSEMPTWLNAADALLVTSQHEGSPNIVKEALACGLPVVSVEVGDVAEQIKSLEGCHLSSPDPAVLAAKLRLVWQRGKRLDCRARCEELSALRIAHKLKEFYEEIVRKGASPRNRAPEDRVAVPVSFPADPGAAFTKQVAFSKRKRGLAAKAMRKRLTPSARK